MQLVDNNLQYNLTQRYNHSRNEFSSSVSANYIVSSGEYSLGYNYDLNIMLSISVQREHYYCILAG